MENKKELDKYLFIVSKDRPLSLEKHAWMKKNFEYVPYTDEDGESCMELETYKAYTALIMVMKKKYHLDVDSHSAWRSIATQEKVYKEMAEKYGEDWAKSHVAIPGTSEHHTGLAFDLRFKPSIVPESLRERAKQIIKKTGMQSKIFALIEKEAVKFGLIKRYDSSKEEITGVKGEAWHFRYVGVEHAKKMYESGMCLEEYVRELELKQKENKTTRVA